MQYHLLLAVVFSIAALGATAAPIDIGNVRAAEPLVRLPRAEESREPEPAPGYVFLAIRLFHIHDTFPVLLLYW
ncbi:hypothetical protein B0H16DRAFT_1733376 [Mycena metata]|uniref:Uncharacterized protein n=1 Tax=Mycena metata TaxID=1033252 RepID=A0AAD7MUH1_9AGAR|nr:hypothetical protein B0H16DRAFT_1733376 [Mycena metata]